MGVESRSLTRTLKSMEENDLIKRTPCATDGRVVLIHLTEEGKKYRDTSREVVMNLNGYLIENLTTTELKNFISVVKKISGLLDKEEVYSAFDTEKKSRKA